MKKILKQGAVALFIVSMTVLHVVPALAASNAAADSKTERAVLTSYKAVNETARKKANVITSIYGASSVQYALIDNGEIKVSGSSGVYSKDSKEKVTKDNMYGIGSISKVFTAAAVMQLVDDDKVKLDEPVITYIPEFKMADERYKKITVRMLLNHSSGFMGSTLQNVALLNEKSTFYHDNFLKSLENQRLKAEPGAFSVYCNDGFTLAEILIEKVSNKTYTDYISGNITKPLAMKSTKTPMNTFHQQRLVKTYVPGVEDTVPVNSFNAIGAGGIYSSAEDLCRFVTMFMKDSPVMLSENSIASMEQKEYLKGLWPMDGDSVLGYGLGWDSVNMYPFSQYGIKALMKGGDTYLYHGSIIVLPEYNMAAAVLSSGGSSIFDQLMAQEILLTALKEKGIIKEILADKTFSKPIPEKVPVSNKIYEGTYLSLNSGIQIKMGEDSLAMSIIGMKDKVISYTYAGNNNFISADGGIILSFVKEKNDKIYLKVDSYNSLPGLGQTASISYDYEKAKDNQVSAKAEQAWKDRMKKKYFVIGERFDSQIYMFGLPAVAITGIDNLSGYINNVAIIDENQAKSLLEIPGSGGRDLSDYDSYQKDGIEYMIMGGRTTVSSDGVKYLSALSGFKTTIRKDGYAKVYSIPKKSGGKVIKVKVPKNASYAVYDKNGKYVNFSWFSKEYRTKLPAGGYILFMGDPNAEFTVNYQN